MRRGAPVGTVGKPDYFVAKLNPRLRTKFVRSGSQPVRWAPVKMQTMNASTKTWHPTKAAWARAKAVELGG